MGIRSHRDAARPPIMVSATTTTTADSSSPDGVPSDGVPSDGVSPEGVSQEEAAARPRMAPASAKAPVVERQIRKGLRSGLLGFFALVAIASAMRDWQFLLIMPIPVGLLWLSPRGASRALLACVAVLVVIGGGVTTYRVGMAVPDWPTTFQENMWTYSLKDMLAEGHGVTLEHAHRFWATGLGLVAISTLLTCFIHRARTAVTLLSGATLLAIIGQGILGGTRVLEVSQNLAFLHGALAQGIVALIAVLAVGASRTWADTKSTESAYAGGAAFLGTVTAGFVYCQIALGAWVRHQGQTVALLIHITLALAVVVVVLTFAKQLSVAATEGQERGIDRRVLARIQRWLLGSLIAQFTLGILATVGIYFFSGGMYIDEPMQAEVSVGEAIFATAHVFVGAILLSTTVIGAAYARRALHSAPVKAA